MRTVGDAVTVKVVAGPVVRGHVGRMFSASRSLSGCYVVSLELVFRVV